MLHVHVLYVCVCIDPFSPSVLPFCFFLPTLTPVLPSQSPPVEWGQGCLPKSAMYVLPYVIAWCQDAGLIEVFNLVHQRCVQEISLSMRCIVV